jgi:hypothetical protein
LWPGVVDELRLAGPLAGPRLEQDPDDGREYFGSVDETGRRLMVRVDAVPLPTGRQARVHVNTSTDNHVIQLSDQLTDDEIGLALSIAAAELTAVRRRAELDLPPVRTQLLDPTRTDRQDDPRTAAFSANDLIRIAALDWHARTAADPGLDPARRIAARDAFSAAVDDCGLRVRGNAVGEDDACAYRTLAVEPLLSSPGARWLAELGRPLEQLPAADQEALRQHRVAAADRAPAQVQAVAIVETADRAQLQEVADRAQAERARMSALTMETLRAGTLPRVRLMVGGGAALTARESNMVVVDDRQRWHVDPIRELVQSTDQMRHLHDSGLGDPYAYARPRERFPLAALHYMEDTAAASGPVVNGRVRLDIDPSGRLMGEIRPSDGSAAVSVEVDGVPLIATGLPAERVPGVSRTVETVASALDVVNGHLTAIGSRQALELRDQLGRLLPDADDPGVAEVVLETLRRAGLSDSPELTEPMRTLTATADWDRAREAAPGRAVFGDEVSNGMCDPRDAQTWLIAGRGGSGYASAAIILDGNPDASVVMVGLTPPMVMRNTALYGPFREAHDRSVNPAASGRLVTVSNTRLGPVSAVTGGDGGTMFRMVDDRGQELRIGDGQLVQTDAYVACTGRPPRLPRALDQLARWAEQSSGEMLMNPDRQYLGYRMTFANRNVQHAVHVIGAASRVLPPEVFTPADVRRLVEIDLQAAPPESGNVGVGFMSTAIQGTHVAEFRAEQSTPTSRSVHAAIQSQPAQASDDLAQVLRVAGVDTNRPGPDGSVASQPASGATRRTPGSPPLQR